MNDGVLIMVRCGDEGSNSVRSDLHQGLGRMVHRSRRAIKMDVIGRWKDDGV